MGNPLPPPPPPGLPQWGAPPSAPPPPAPPGYVPYGGPAAGPGAAQSPAAGVRTAIVILMWVTVVLVAAFAAAAFNRWSVWEGFVDGDKTLTDVDDADSLIGVTAGLSMLVVLTIAILLAIWSSRAAGNGAARGASANPGLAAGGWFIPLAWHIVPFMQLRKAMGGRGRGSLVTRWQIAWLVATVGLVAQRVVGNIDESSTRFDDVGDRLRNQGIVLAVTTAVLILVAVTATAAMRHVDEVTSGASV